MLTVQTGHYQLWQSASPFYSTYHLSFGNRGNGLYREELRQALAALDRYLTAYQLPKERVLLRLDGQYGSGAVLSDLAGFAFVTRGREFTVLDHPLVQTRLHLPPDHLQQRPESQVVRSLYDCPDVPLEPEGVRCRVVVATHPEGLKKSPVGVTRAGVVYELFFTALPQEGFTACDVVELYLHRGAFEPTLADEDQEIDPDRWCSHSDCGQEAWCIISQWVWNLRLELGHELEPTPVRTTEFAPAIAEPGEQAAASSVPATGYGPPTAATSWKTGRFSGHDFPLQPCWTLRCPAGQKLVAQERRREADGSLRVVYAASIRSCRPARCVSSVNGMVTPPRSRGRSVSCWIHSDWVPQPCSGEIGTAESIGVLACSSCDTNAWK